MVCDFSYKYKPDYKVLFELKSLIEKEAESKEAMERWSYDGLVEGLDKFIRRESRESRIE